MKTELLAPAKNIDIAIQAINCGADAIYIGSVAFGARQNAGNSLEDIEKLVNYAHKFYVKIYVTVNTVISDGEINEVIELIKNLYKIGVDAIIIQDMAIIQLFMDNKIPPIPLHISTQCNNRTIKKIKFFADMGISRVVLARELSLKQLEAISQEIKNVEFEVFAHGALCVSYSGQCYLSHFIGNRSANMGKCAQPCRKKYSLIDENGKIISKSKHLLSLKDFNTSKVLDKLVNIGITSFKIEGRLKDELYVKNVIAYYRTELDKISEKTSSGKITLGFKPDLEKTFNRNYTTYFLENRENCFNFNTPKFIGEKLGKVSKITDKYFEIDNKTIKLNTQDGLCFNKTADIGCIINKIEGSKIFPNKMLGIKVGMNVYRNNDSYFEKNVLKSKTKRQIGITVQINNNIIRVTDEDNNSIEHKIIEIELPNNPDKNKAMFIKNFSKTGNSDFYIKNIEILTDLPFIPASQINEYRRNIFDELMIERLKNYPKITQHPLKHTDYPKNKIDYRGNVHNNIAKAFYKNCNCEVLECSFEQNKPNRQVELMRTKHCLKYAHNMCKSDKRLFLIDEKGVKYPLLFDCKNCEMAILSPN